MPILRRRGGTSTPCSGAETMAPLMRIVPDVGCSSPATQRSVVVLPQPDGPSSTTISPAGTAKLTPSIAGRPIANCLRRSVTSSVPVMILFSRHRSLPVAESLVPFGNPRSVQLDVFVEVREPELDNLGIETIGIDRRHLQRGQIAELLDHEGLPFYRHAPVENKFRRVRG